jgi:hypothetical protein
LTFEGQNGQIILSKRGELLRLATTLNKPLNSYEFSSLRFLETLCCLAQSFFDEICNFNTA